MTTGKGRIRWSLVAVALAASLLTGACGSEEEPSPSARGTLERSLRAFAQKDADALCETLSRRAREVIGHAAHARPTTCRRDVRRYFQWIEADRAGKVVSVSRADPTRPFAHVKLPDGSDVNVPFVREDGRWKVDGLFDASLSRIQVRATPREEQLTAGALSPPASPGPGDLTAWRGTSRCPDVDVSEFPVVTGGCVLRFDGQRVTLSGASAFGTLPFSDCGVSFDLHVDEDGNAWVVDFAVDHGSVVVKPSDDNPCFDVMACQDKQREKIPWQARIGGEPGDRRLLVEDVCLDTCVGRFEGDWTLQIEAGGPAWRMRADKSMVGKTGWQFDGALNSDRALTLAQR